MSKNSALDKVKDIMELFRERHPHEPRQLCKDKTLIAIEELRKFFELPIQDDSSVKDRRVMEK